MIMMEILANMVIILYYINLSNQHILYLKLIYNVICQFYLNEYGKLKKEFANTAKIKQRIRVFYSI